MHTHNVIHLLYKHTMPNILDRSFVSDFKFRQIRLIVQLVNAEFMQLKFSSAMVFSSLCLPGKRTELRSHIMCCVMCNTFMANYRLVEVRLYVNDVILANLLLLIVVQAFFVYFFYVANVGKT